MGFPADFQHLARRNAVNGCIADFDVTGCTFVFRLLRVELSSVDGGLPRRRLADEREN
jgi:hypothetical protein